MVNMAKKRTDTEILIAYDAHLARLRSSAVLREGIVNTGKVVWDAEDPVLRTQASVEENPFLAFCVLFRPLWLNDSPQNFHVVSGVLRRADLPDKERAHLDRCCAHWKRNCRESPMYIGIGQSGEEPVRRTPADWIADILGETHHPYGDETRTAVIGHITTLMGEDGWPFIQGHVLPNMIELTKAAMGLHEIVKNVLARCAEVSGR